MKIKKGLGYAISVFLPIIVVVCIGFSLYQMTIENIWLAVLCLAVGYFLSGFVYVLIHELGHLFGGLAGKFKFYSFSVLFFKLIKINNKIKLRFSFSRNIAGYCQMIPPKSDKLESAFKTYVIGAYISSLIFIICSLIISVSPLIFPTLFASNYIIYCLLAPAFVSAFPTHFANFSSITENPASDGAILRGIKENSHSAQIQIKLISLQSLIFSGTRPRDLESELFENLDFTSETKSYAPLFQSYNLSRLLDLGDIQGTIKASDFIKAHYKETVEVFHSLLLCDVFYTELVLKNNISEAERIYFYIAKFLKGQTDISTLRIRMAKEIYIDKSYSQALNTGVQAKNLSSAYIASGGAEMECDIIDSLSVIARKKKEEEFANMTVDFKGVE